MRLLILLASTLLLSGCQIINWYTFERFGSQELYVPGRRGGYVLVRQGETVALGSMNRPWPVSFRIGECDYAYVWPAARSGLSHVSVELRDDKKFYLIKRGGLFGGRFSTQPSGWPLEPTSETCD